MNFMIHNFLAIVTAVASIALLVPIVVFSAQCLLALVARFDRPRATGLTPFHSCQAQQNIAAMPPRERLNPRPRLAIVIPAHNEQASIRGVVANVREQLDADDRLLVVADNCTDSTARCAKNAGAEVVERHDTSQLGKSHALAFGLRHLAPAPPQAVVVLDADCRILPGAIDSLAEAVGTTGRPAQASYTFTCDDGQDLSRVISALAIFFKNHIRPLGLSRLGLPCQLTGCGMAFPWRALQAVRIDNAAMTEDTQLGIDLVLAGYPPVFCPAAEVVTRLPSHWDAHVGQRRRWEHGYLVTILTQVPRLLLASATRLRLAPLCVAIDFLVPPLALLGVLWCGAMLLAGHVAYHHNLWWPLLLQSSGGLLMGFSVGAPWAVFCRQTVPLRALLAAPWYIVRKLPIYGSFFWNRQKVWLRTERHEG